MLKHNTYFDGQVQSIGFERHGRRLTVGVVERGEYQFNTEAAERMTVVSGELWMRAAGHEEWARYPAATAFEVAAKSSFTVKALASSAYVCEFLG